MDDSYTDHVLRRILRPVELTLVVVLVGIRNEKCSMLGSPSSTKRDAIHIGHSQCYTGAVASHCTSNNPYANTIHHVLQRDNIVVFNPAETPSPHFIQATLLCSDLSIVTLWTFSRHTKHTWIRLNTRKHQALRENILRAPRLKLA